MVEKKNKNKDKQLLLRLSSSDLDYIKNKAKKMNLTTSEFMRRIAKYGVCYRINFSEANNILYELNKIGTNINQIARGLNTAIITNKNVNSEDLKEVLDLYYHDLRALQLTCEEYFANNSIKQLEKLSIDE